VVKSRLPTLNVGWRSDGHGSFPRLVLYRLVAPPLQSEVVDPFFVRGVWFASRLPLGGPDRI
jgi:hypothetical protein